MLKGGLENSERKNTPRYYLLPKCKLVVGKWATRAMALDVVYFLYAIQYCARSGAGPPQRLS